MGSIKLVGLSALCIEKLSGTNLNTWKPKIEFVLAFCKVDVAIFEENQFLQGSHNYAKWKQCDKLAWAINDPTLSDGIVEHVCD